MTVNQRDLTSLKQQAYARLQANRLDEAGDLFETLCRQEPGDLEAHYWLAAIQGQTGHYIEAEQGFRHVLSLNPALVRAWCGLGMAQIAQGKRDDAEASFKNALRYEPGNTSACAYLGNILRSKGEMDQSVAYYRQALQQEPGNASLLFSLGSCLLAMGSNENAAAVLQKAVQQKADFPEAYQCLGSALYALNRPGQAEASLRESLRLKPDNSAAGTALGTALLGQGRYEEALAAYREAIRLDKDNAQAHWNLAILCLLLGNLREGWHEYEWRRKCGIDNRDFPLPRWDGAPLDDRTALVYAEQGMGDEIMFASCLPDLVRRAGHVVLDCSPRLAPLFARSFPQVTIHAGLKKDPVDWLEGVRPIDVQVAIGSLPRLMRSSLDEFPRQEHYLVPDEQATGEWRGRFAGLGDGLKVGISWRGGSNPLSRALRTIPLVEWMPVFSLPGITFVNLQYGDCAGELESFWDATGVEIHDWEDANPYRSLDGFAAQIAALDLVVSVDNTTIHMAGSLGKPVWGLLPAVPDWRWLLERDDSPWYASVRLFRQPLQGKWQPVIERVAQALQDGEG